MLFDHYLTLRQWTPNFLSSGPKVDRVTVWVRLPGIPIEYNASKVLRIIGNRIGRTIRLDVMMKLQMRGKYAWIYDEVELDKPLLTWFKLKEGNLGPLQFSLW